MSAFSANLKYDLVTKERTEEALKTVSSESAPSPNFTLNFSIADEHYLFVSITASSSSFLQEGLNAVYPIVEKVF